MAAIAFDPVEFAQQLESTGMPRAQAEVVARGLTSMFIHNFDALVTRDYLDTRFTEFETRIEAKMDSRFANVDNRFVELETQVDRRLADFRLEMRGDTSELRSVLKLHSWMLSILIAATLLPVVQKLVS